MKFVVTLNFDKNTEEKIACSIEELKSNNISVSKISPHISLSFFYHENRDIVNREIAAYFANIKPIRLTVNSIGAFSENVLYYAPTVTEELLQIQRGLYEVLKDDATEFWHYFLPGDWTPHISLAMDGCQNEVISAFGIVFKEFQPFEIQCTNVSVVQYEPNLEFFKIEL